MQNTDDGVKQQDTNPFVVKSRSHFVRAPFDLSKEPLEQMPYRVLDLPHFDSVGEFKNATRFELLFTGTSVVKNEFANAVNFALNAGFC